MKMNKNGQKGTFLDHLPLSSVLLCFGTTPCEWLEDNCWWKHLLTMGFWVLFLFKPLLKRRLGWLFSGNIWVLIFLLNILLQWHHMTVFFCSRRNLLLLTEEIQWVSRRASIEGVMPSLYYASFIVSLAGVWVRTFILKQLFFCRGQGSNRGPSD